MADRIKGITVQIGGDTTGLSKALKGTNKEIKDTQAQLKEVMPGTDRLRHLVIDQPARDAWDEYEDVQVYHPYTPEELAERNKPTLEQRVTATEDALLELMLRQGGAAYV